MLRTAILAMLIVAAAAVPASAATFTVTTTRDATDAGINGVCAVAGGGCSLRAAIQEANATTAADAITLPAGRYRITLAGTGEDAAATGDFDSTHDLTITGTGANGTVIDGNGADRVIHEVGGDLTIQGVRVTGGFIAEGGAGILQDAGHLIVRDSAVVDNTADPAANPSGGGIYATGSTALVERSLLAGNHAYNGGAIDGGAGITVRSSTLAHNTAGTRDANGDGGAVDTAATILDSTIVGNIAWNGDGSPGGVRGGTLRNTVLADNVSFNTSDPNAPGVRDNCSGAITSHGGNVSDDDTCAFAGTADRNQLDPQLSDLSSHGGPFESIVPLPASPLIDTGTGCDPLDMRGLSRPRGAGCDVGAAETSAPGPANTAASAIGQTAAAVSGVVDTGFSPTTIHVDYGTTTAYGSSTPETPADGVFAVTLVGLAPGTAYHARIVASNAYGTTAGTDVTFTTVATPATPAAPDTRPARMSKLKLSKKARGKLTFSLDERATVTFTFVRSNGRRVTQKVSGRAGKNTVRLSRKLKAGRYVLVVSVSDRAGNTSAPVIKTVRLRRP